MSDKNHNYNPKSRDNLKQYGGSSKKVRNYEEKFEKFIKEKKLLLTLDMLKDLIPYEDIFKDKETPQFFNILMLHLEDYAGEITLSTSDLHDIINICNLTILKYRVIKDSKTQGEIKDAVKFIESIDKSIEKAKTNLGANRSARVDPKIKKNTTVVDLIGEYDTKTGRNRALRDIQKMLEQEDDVEGYATSMEEVIEY